MIRTRTSTRVTGSKEKVHYYHQRILLFLVVFVLLVAVKVVDGFIILTPATDFTAANLRVVLLRTHGVSRSITRTIIGPPRMQALSSSSSTSDQDHLDTDAIIIREDEQKTTKEATVWEQMARALIWEEDDAKVNPKQFVQYISLLRVAIPAFLYATTAKTLYPVVALMLAAAINDSGVFAVVSQDASQYIQNILTTSGLVFSLLVGQTYYFMYQQQEAIYLALYDEVSMAKSLLEQIALICQGRDQLYHRILQQMDRYVQTDLQRFNDVEPAVLLSARPCDDPLEDILYLTSVGEPSTVYQTVRALRQARAYRLGALQRKLPNIHMVLLWVLAGVVLFTFPLLGAGVQTIGGTEILTVQSFYLAFIVFGISLTMGVIYELQRPDESGAYNARTVLAVMVEGLEEELKQRLQGQSFPIETSSSSSSDIDYGPSIDADGGYYYSQDEDDVLTSE